MCDGGVCIKQIGGEEHFKPQAAGACSREGGTVLQQLAIQVQTYVRLQAFRKSFQHRVHIDAVRVRPGVLEILFKALP